MSLEVDELGELPQRSCSACVSVQSVIAPRVFDRGPHEAGQQLVQEMETSSRARALEPPTLLEIEHAVQGKAENVNEPN